MKNSEHIEQAQLIRWAELQKCKWPALGLLYAIPNGANTNARQGAYMKAEGLKRGVPDLCLPVARGPFHGMYLEFKPAHTPGKTNKTYPTLSQKQWLRVLTAQGYFASVVYGFDEAKTTILNYLNQ